MKIDINKIKAQAIKTIKVLAGYANFITIMIFLLTYVFLAVKIRSNIQKTPDQDTITQKLNNIATPKIDQNAVDKMNQLRDQNVQVKTLFDKARKNPFSE